jgi:hypothetical protein
MAVDMAIAEQADVFLGNGVSISSNVFHTVFAVANSHSQFSSLTANIITLRLARGMDPASNRFL